MSRVVNAAQMTVSGTPGTGTVTLGSPTPSHLSFSAAGCVDGTRYSYVLVDGTQREGGEGTYHSSGNTFSRDFVEFSTAGGTTKISATSNAIIHITPLAADITAEDHADTVAIFETSSFEYNIHVVSILGYHTVGVGPFQVRRVAAEPAHVWKFRSTDRNMPDESYDAANGGWWEGFTEGNVYDVRWFGAKFDGVTNDTVAIQNCIDFVATGGNPYDPNGNTPPTGVTPPCGGIVQMPAGTAIIQPGFLGDSTWPNSGAALYIRSYYTALTIKGTGQELTKLLFRNYDGSDPATVFPIWPGNGAVYRGHGFYVEWRTRVTFEDFELDGGTVTSNTTSNGYADPVTGKGYDGSHIGINMIVNSVLYNVNVTRMNIHGWRGGSLYYGGGDLQSIIVRDSIMGDTDGDIVSLSANEFVMENCSLYNASTNAVENAFIGGGREVIRNCYFHDIMRYSITYIPSSDLQSYTTNEITGNKFYNSGWGDGGTRSTIAIGAPMNVVIRDNVFLDCYSSIIAITGESGGGSNLPGVHIKGNGLEIYNNTFIADKTSFYSAVYLNMVYDAYGPALNVYVHDNTGYISEYGLAHGVTAQYMLSGLDPKSLHIGAGCRFERNYLKDNSGRNEWDFVRLDSTYACADASIRYQGTVANLIYPSPGARAVITDSDVRTVGALITGSGTSKVIAQFGGMFWYVERDLSGVLPSAVGSGPKLWLKADTLTPGAMTTPFTDNGRTPITMTPVNSPTVLSADWNGLNAIEFVSASSQKITFPNIDLTGGATMLVVLFLERNKNAPVLNTTTGTDMCIAIENGGVWSSGIGGATGPRSTNGFFTPQSVDTFKAHNIVSVVNNAGTATGNKIYLNAVDNTGVVNVAAGAAWNQVSNIGYGDGPIYGDFKLCELIVFDHTTYAPSTAEIKDMITYLGNKWQTMTTLTW